MSKEKEKKYMWREREMFTERGVCTERGDRDM